MRYKSIAIVGVLLVALVLFALSNPATAACVITDGDRITEPHLALVEKARARISNKFGPLESRPILYFFDDANSHWPVRLNEYASTAFLGYKTCIAVGPRGQSVDVVAHELMHAEIASRVGFLSRFRKVPVWFDEGLAMQVDFRKRYDLQEGDDYSFVTQLNTSRAFFVSDTERLTNHYAAAKAAVKIWLSGVNENDVYSQLEKLNEGAAFESIWKTAETKM